MTDSLISLAYSAWHRRLGYGYYAMDIDYVEFRAGVPVALTEVSLPTPRFPKCDGSGGVFDRFLGETAGFQFEVIWWLAAWLRVPAYVVCLPSPTTVAFLSLSDATVTSLSSTEYLSFLSSLPTGVSDPLPLSALLDELVTRYPRLRRYPYFSRRSLWLAEYSERRSQVDRRERRVPPATSPPPLVFPVKGETTGRRPDDYAWLRSRLDLPFVTIDWLEWRKRSHTDLIGRPAALVRTVCLSAAPSNRLPERASTHHESFVSSLDARHLGVLADRLLVPSYSVYFTSDLDQFVVYGSPAPSTGRVLDAKAYAAFVMSM